MADKPLCLISDCCKAARTRGWCAAHYKKWLIYGDPLAGFERQEEYGSRRKWLDRHIGHRGDGCLIYPFSRSPNGYSIITLPGGLQISAHRYMCEAVHGLSPSADHEVAHSCGNRHCVNPGHLRWATKGENTADRLVHGTDPRGEKNGHSKLTEDQVREIISLRGVETGRALAKRFGVTAAQISNIQLGKQWVYPD